MSGHSRTFYLVVPKYVVVLVVELPTCTSQTNRVVVGGGSSWRRRMILLFVGGSSRSMPLGLTANGWHRLDRLE